MKKSYDASGYALDSFDENLCLKPPWLLLAAVLFLTRDFLIPIAFAVTRLNGGEIDGTWLIESQPSFWFLRELPAVAFLYGWVRRTPKADPVARFAWKHGRWLLLGAAALQFWPLAVSLVEGDADTPTVVIVGLLLLVAGYVVLNPRVRHAMSDFPSAASAA